MIREKGRRLSLLAVLMVLGARLYAAPLTISDLTALASPSVEGQVQLAWTVPDTRDGASMPTGYLIKYSSMSEIGSADLYAIWASTYNYNWTVFAASGTAQTVTLTGLIPGDTYYFAAAAMDMSSVYGVWPGTSAAVNSQNFALIYDTVPGQVFGVTFDYGNNFINVSWQQNTEIDLKDYRVESSSYSNLTGYTDIAQITKPGTTFQHTNLINGNTYFYRVRAEDNNGNLGIFSVVQSTRPWISLGQPLILAR